MDTELDVRFNDFNVSTPSSMDVDDLQIEIKAIINELLQEVVDGTNGAQNNTRNEDNGELIDDLEEKLEIDEDEEVQKVVVTMDNWIDAVKSESGDLVSTLRVAKVLIKQFDRKRIKDKIKNLEKKKVTVVVDSEKEQIQIESAETIAFDQAKMQLTQILLSLRFKTPFTHFLSLAFNCPAMQSRFEDFKQQVLQTTSELDKRKGDENVTNNQQPTNVDEHLFQNPLKLHMTFGILYLMNERERQDATRLMEALRDPVINDILENKPLIVDVKGIEVMRNNPKKSNVLFATLKNPSSNEDHLSRLQKMADFLVSKFEEAGFMEAGSSRNPVKLHITLMNTTLRGRRLRKQLKDMQIKADDNIEGASAPKKPRRNVIGFRNTFDALPILAEFNDFSFVSNHNINEVHISCAQGVDGSGFYKPLTKLILPSIDS